MNYKLTLAYDGTRYRGWQRLPGDPQSIQSRIEAVLSRMEGAPVQISGSGRTDAGVHALGQVASVHLSGDRTPREILDYVEQKTGKKAVLNAGGDAAPYNGEPEYSINTDLAASLGFRFSRLHDWIFELLDYYIELLRQNT